MTNSNGWQDPSLQLRARAERERRKRQRAKSLGLQRTDVDGTDAEILEAFARRYRDDYVGFTELLHVDSKRGRVPFKLNSIQREYHAARTPRDVVLKARRVGMTTEAVARDIHHLLTFRGIPAVNIVCQSIDGHAPVLVLNRIITIFFASLRERGLPLKFSKASTQEWELADRPGSLSIVEAGASRAAASKKGRAGRVTRLHATEVAFWEYAGETLNALVECVDAPQFGTEIQYESTPNGAASDDRSDPKSASGAALFHWIVVDAQRGEGGYRLHFVPWFADDECRIPLDAGEVVEPRTDQERALVAKGVQPDQLKWYQKKLADKKSQDLVDQEYPSDPDTCFLMSGRPFFEASVTKRLLMQAREPIVIQHIRSSGAYGQVIGGHEIPAIRVWHEPAPGQSYVVSADPAEGTGGHPSAGGVFERGTGRHMATIWGQFRPWEFGRICVAVARKYNHALLAPERNNHGHTFIRAAEADCKYGDFMFVDRDEKYGWLTNETSRTAALELLEQSYRQGHATTVDRFLLGEIRTFVVKLVGSRERAEASSGCFDDLVMMFAIGWDVLCRPIQRRGNTELPVA